MLLKPRAVLAAQLVAVVVCVLTPTAVAQDASTAQYRGTVYAADGELVAGATVFAEPGDLSGRDFEPSFLRSPESTTTDEHGAFVIDVRASASSPEVCKLWAVADDKETPFVLAQFTGGEVLCLKLRFTGVFAITGRVIDEDGDPIAGAHVSPPHDSQSGFDQTTRTDSDGRFLIDLNVSGRFELDVETPGLIQSEAVRVELSDASPEAEVEIVMIRPTVIGGTARWSDGEPIRVSMISARPQRSLSGIDLPSSAGSGQSFESTDARGAFLIEGLHPDGIYRLHAYGGDPVAQQVNVRGVAAGMRGVEIVFSREKAKGYSVTGRVTDAATGAAVPSFKVSIGMWVHGVHDPDNSRFNDPDGRFALTELLDWTFGIEVQADGYPAKVVGPFTPSGSEVHLDIQLARVGGLDVSVVDEQGESVEGADVIICRKVGTPDYDLYENSHYQVSPLDGALSWRDIPSGPYYVQSALGDLRSDVATLDVPSGQTESIQVTLHRQLAPGSIIARVLRSDGTPFTPAVVSFSLMADWLGVDQSDMDPCAEDDSVDVVVDDTGIAKATQLVPGHYWVWPNLEQPGAFIGPKHVLVFAGKTAEVKFGGDD